MVWCDHVVVLAEDGDQVAEHVGTAGISVQQEQDRGVLWSGFPVEDVEPVDRDRAVVHNRHH